jgi:hypothetical protein
VDQWRGAVDRYREAAKWMIGAFAVIGALLAGTAPLAGIGGVDAERLPALVAGGLLGLLGVGLAIVATVSMLIPRSVYWYEIRAKNQRWWGKLFRGLGPLEDMLAEHPDSVLPPGVVSLADFNEGIRNLRKLVFEARAAAAAAPASGRQRALADVADKEAALNEYLDAQDELMLVGRFEKARTGFRIALTVVVLGAVFAGTGLGLLLYGVSDDVAHKQATANVVKTQADTDKTRADADQVRADTAKTRAETNLGQPTAAPPVTVKGAPIPVQLAFTPEGGQAVQGALGPSCDLESVSAQALSGDSTTGTWDVITVQTPNCNAVRLNITSRIATSTPR